MTKEELFAQGWELIYSDPSSVAGWGKWVVHLQHQSGRRVNGYGTDESAAMSEAMETINKPLEDTKK